MLAETNSVAQIVWARYALALPILLATTRPSQLPTLFRTRRPGLQILRGLAPLAVSVGMVFGVRYLPLAEATVILFAAPFLVAALSVPLLGERVHASSWIAVGDRLHGRADRGAAGVQRAVAVRALSAGRRRVLRGAAADHTPAGGRRRARRDARSPGRCSPASWSRRRSRSISGNRSTSEAGR